MKLAKDKTTSGDALQAAISHHRAGRLAEAKSIYQQLLAADPSNADALHLLGLVAHQTGDGAAAVDLIEKAVRLDASCPHFFSNLGEAYSELGRTVDAERVYRQAIALNPDYAGAYTNLGNALRTLGRFEEAAQSFRDAIRLDPALAPARLNYALLQLLRGDYESGFALYESRFGAVHDPRIAPARAILAALSETPRWQGDELNGRRLLVWTEQGFGDSLMMLRYLPLLKRRGAGRLIVYCEPALFRLVRFIPEVDEVTSQASVPLDGFDCHCPLMALPLLFGTRVETIPSAFPYLRVPQTLRQRWSDRLARIKAPKVGLVWAGGQRNAAEAYRSMRLQNLALLVKTASLQFVSLQKDDDAGELRHSGFDILDVMNECEDFLDTAALVDQLDMVISVDTSVAHLAGALGKPVWLVARFDSAWQWLTGREDSPWYPTMRIFRQRERGNWDEVIARVVEAFRETWPGATRR